MNTRIRATLAALTGLLASALVVVQPAPPAMAADVQPDSPRVFEDTPQVIKVLANDTAAPTNATGELGVTSIGTPWHGTAAPWYLPEPAVAADGCDHDPIFSVPDHCAHALRDTDVAQSFVAPTSGTISSVDLALYRDSTNTSGLVTVQLWSMPDTMYTLGSMVAEQQFVETDITATDAAQDALHHVSFAAAVPVVGGARYAVVVSAGNTSVRWHSTAMMPDADFQDADSMRSLVRFPDNPAWFFTGANAVFRANLDAIRPKSAKRITYTPSADYNGWDQVTFSVCDEGIVNGCTASRADISVIEVNDAPVAAADQADMLATAPGGTLVDVLANDRPGPANEADQTMTLTEAHASAGTATIEAGKVRYTAPADNSFSGTDTISYSVCDDGTTDGRPAPLCTTGVATVRVITKLNTPVSAFADSRSVAEDGVVTIPVAANDSANDDGQSLTLTSVSTPLRGAVTVLDGDVVRYTPYTNFSGSDSFRYTVCDNGTPISCASATVRIAVSPVNDAPTLTTGRPAVTVAHSDAMPPIQVAASDVDDALSAQRLVVTGMPLGITATNSGLRITLSGNVIAPAATYKPVVSISDGKATTRLVLTIIVTRETVTLKYTGTQYFTKVAGSSADVALSAKVSQSDDGAPASLSRAKVEFALYGAGNEDMLAPDRTVLALASATGVVTATAVGLPTGSWTVIARMQSSNQFLAANNASPSAVTVARDQEDTATGGGKIDGAAFGVSLRNRTTTTGVQTPGSMTYSYRGVDGLDYVVRHTTSSSALTFSRLVTGIFRAATWTGDATLTVLDPATKTIVRSAPLSYSMKVNDASPAGLALDLRNADGSLFRQIGTFPAGAEPVLAGLDAGDMFVKSTR
jgi:Bacterial Ig domain